MKTSILFALLFVFVFFFKEDAVVLWETPQTFEFGKVDYQKPVETEFLFKNIHDQAISIDNVRPGCGCTSPNWEEVLIEPGDTGRIRIEYDALKLGYFKQKIKVYFNVQRRAEILYVEGTVVE